MLFSEFHAHLDTKELHKYGGLGALFNLIFFFFTPVNFSQNMISNVVGIPPPPPHPKKKIINVYCHVR